MKIPTRHCKICFKEINDNSIRNIFVKQNNICENCYKEFNPKFIKFKHGNINCLAIYEYDQTIKDLLYKFKGCYDYELKDVFLERYLWYFKLKYYGYKIICLPSYYLEDEKRGFNHVNEIAKSLKLPIIPALTKTKNIKQANLHSKERKNIFKYLELSHLEEIRNSKILIMDDVYTTGSSVDAAIRLIESAKPKKIEVLVISKNVKKPHNTNIS